MNRYYIFIPIALMAVFIYFERGASKEAAVAREQQIEAKAKEDAKKAADKKALEEKAKADSEKRNADRIKAEQDKEEKRKADFQAKLQKLKDDAKRYTDSVELNTKLVASLEKELAAKRATRDSENRLVLDLAKKVEISKKARRAAELEVQRFTEMLATRAGESSLTKAPAVATAETPAK